MTISKRQFQHLSEMGIDLWHARANSKPTEDEQEKQPITLELAELAKDKFFADILTSLSLSIADITEKHDHIDLGLFNWFFYDDIANLSYQHAKLITPSLDEIKHSAMMKKQLWQLISNHLYEQTNL